MSNYCKRNIIRFLKKNVKNEKSVLNFYLTSHELKVMVWLLLMILSINRQVHYKFCSNARSRLHAHCAPVIFCNDKI